MAQLEKVNKDIERLNEQISSLTSKKRELETKKKSAMDAELASVFKGRKIKPERFLVLKRLSDEQLEKVIADAEKMANTEVKENN